jgi:hypothetical protein
VVPPPAAPAELMQPEPNSVVFKTMNNPNTSPERELGRCSGGCRPGIIDATLVNDLKFGEREGRHAADSRRLS